MKVKGQGIHDRFYLKVQDDIISKLIDGVIYKPVVLEWNYSHFYVTTDHASFYIIPKDKFYLKETFIESVGDYFPGFTFVKDVYWGEFEKCQLTGNVLHLDPSNAKHPKALLELSDFTGQKFIQEDLLTLFPKQRIFCISKEHPSGPVFVLTTLRSLLGGVFPVKK